MTRSDSAALSADLKAQAQELLPRMVAWRRALHQEPELGLDCPKAAALVCEVLAGLGCVMRTGIAGSGVAALLPGGPGPVAALRVDMDALPLQEKTGLPFASRVAGRMHACGHDGHTAMGLGAACLLAAQSRALPGPVLFLFQPGEEYPGGARPMIEAGCLESPRPDWILGLHLFPDLAPGRVGVCSGPVTAGNVEFTITCRGRGGHAARPAQCVNPIEAAARLVLALHAMTRTEPEPLVVSVAEVRAGSGHNVIPDEAAIKGTLRFLSTRAMDEALAAMRGLMLAVQAQTGARLELATRLDGPPMVLPPDLAGRMAVLAADVAGPDRVDMLTEPSMGAEDFAYFAEALPAAYLRLGCGGGHGLHSPQFDFDEGVMAQGAAVLAWCLLRGGSD